MMDMLSTSQVGIALGQVTGISIIPSGDNVDKVLGLAAAAVGYIPLFIIGMAVSIPLIILRNTVILILRDCFPVIVTVDSALRCLPMLQGKCQSGIRRMVHSIRFQANIFYRVAPVVDAIRVVLIDKATGSAKAKADNFSIETMAVA